jgi:hypothetical protein
MLGSGGRLKQRWRFLVGTWRGHLHTLLRNPYYMGMVPYRGAIYAGTHEPLITPETWNEVQKVLAAKYLTGEKDREHPHYLKGSIYRSKCGVRLIVNHAKGNGGTYPYFICGGRQRAVLTIEPDVESLHHRTRPS